MAGWPWLSLAFKIVLHYECMVSKDFLDEETMVGLRHACYLAKLELRLNYSIWQQ